MANLGTPYRVVYAAKNFVSGVTGIVAKVMKPNNAVLGVYALSALPGGVDFAGLYYFDLITSTLDPEGEWVVVIQSPTEGIKDAQRISFSLRAEDVEKAAYLFGQRITAVITKEKAKTCVVQSSRIVAAIKDQKIAKVFQEQLVIGVLQEQNQTIVKGEL